MDRFFLLSEHLDGDILQPIWGSRPEQVEAEYGPGSYPVYCSGEFRYHWWLGFRFQGFRRRLGLLWFFLRKGLSLFRERRYECIITYSHLAPALVGVVLKLCTGARLIVEVVTSPSLAFLHNRPRPTLKDRLGRLYSDASLHIALLFCDEVRLLYETQLADYSLLRRVPAAVFHEFVPVSMIERKESGPYKTVLLVGAPWYLKGADVLVRAFQALESDFPEVRLRIQGHFSQREELDALIRRDAQIEIVKPVRYAEILEAIGQSWVLVLPSRTEGMGRVLLEAMSAGVPVIGSDVGGIPHYIHDGCGFVFPTGDVQQLEMRLRQILSDSELRRRMGARAYEVAHTTYNEQKYVEQFSKMVKAAVEGSL